MQEGRMPDFTDLRSLDAIEGWFKGTVENMIQKFWEDGTPYMKMWVNLDGEGEAASRMFSLETDLGVKNKSVHRELEKLSEHLGLGAAGGYDLQEVVGKKVGVRVSLNKKGYLTIWEFDAVDAERDWKNVGKAADDDVPF